MACVLKRYTGLVFAALAIAGCTEEEKQLEANLQIITPDRQDIISLDASDHQLVLKLERSGSFEWDIDVSSVSGGNAEDWCHCYKLSDTEIAVEVKPHLKKLDPLVFESRQCTIEAFVLSKPELRSSCKLIQKYAASPYLSVGEEAPTDFNVPFSGDTFTFDVNSRFPLEMTVSDSDIRPELIISEAETADGWSGTLSVTIPENLAEVTKVIEVKIGNTIIVDGIEKEYYKVLKFTQASQQFSFEKVTPSASNLFYGGESFDVVLTSEMPWNLVADCPDVEFSASSGAPGSKTVSVQFPANMTDSERTVILTLTQKGTGQNRTIQVVQDKFGGISYTTTDNQKIMIAETPMKVSSHIYENGTGRIATKEPLLEIPVGQFNNCKTLKSIVLPASVMGVGNTAFSECTGLESVTMNDEMETMGGSIFYNCISLRSVKWPKVKDKNEIPNNTFYNCKSLSSFYGPEGLSRVGDYAFYYCPLTETGFDFSAVANDFTLGESAFEGSSLSSVRLPENLTLIPVKAFMNCESLTSIEMGDSVLEIGASAFYECKNLTTISWSKSLESIGSSAFARTSIVRFILPSNVTTIGECMLYGCEKTVSVDMSKTKITYLPEKVFQYSYSLSSVRLPATIVEIEGWFSFSSTNLRELYVPSDDPPIFPPVYDPELNQYWNGILESKDRLTVFVPNASFDKYQQAEIWNQLKLIKYNFN